MVCLFLPTFCASIRQLTCSHLFSVSQLEQSLSRAQSKELKAKAWYNFGNTQYRLGQFDKAIEAYRNALNLNPNDLDAKYNLELLQKKKKLFDIKQKEREQKQKPKPQQQKQQENQQSQQQTGTGSMQKSESQGKEQKEEQQKGEGEQEEFQTG